MKRRVIMDIGQLSPLGFIIVVLGLVSAFVTIIAFVFHIETLKGKFAVLTVIFVGCFIFVRIFSSGNPPTPTSTPSVSGVTQTAINARVTPTATPSPTPTQITITKNLVIPCLQNCAIALKLTTIVIDTTTQTSTWNFTLTNTSDSLHDNFVTLELEDSKGQKHQGAGLAKTDTWVMSSGQTIQTNATFDVVHGTNDLLNISISYNTWYTDTHQTETISF